MQIRISKSGKRIELLRSRYIPEKKRTTQDLVVSFDYSSEQVSEKVLDKLTANEKIEVEVSFILIGNIDTYPLDCLGTTM